MRLGSQLRWMVLVVGFAACGCAADGLPLMASSPPDLAPRDLAAPPDATTIADLSIPPPTITFEIAEFTGAGLSGDTTEVTVPLPTPTEPIIDGIDYLYRGFHDGQYRTTLAWLDTANNNQGWTASFGGYPGAPSWPLVSRLITMTAGATAFGPDKVSIVGIAGAKPNTLVITIRSVASPVSDYGILRQEIRGH
jgi:hypothetical protein